MMHVRVFGAFLFVFCSIVVYVCTHVCVYVCEDQRLIAGVFLSHPPPSFLRQDPSASPALGLQTHSMYLAFYVGPEAV